MSPLESLLRLFDPAPGPPSSIYLVPLTLFALLLAGGAAVYLLRRNLFPGHSLHVRLARRLGIASMGLSAAGLLLVAARYLDLYFVQMRFLVLVASLGVVALAAYAAWYYRNRYPVDLAEHEAAKARDRFVRRGAHSPRRKARKGRR